MDPALSQDTRQCKVKWRKTTIFPAKVSCHTADSQLECFIKYLAQWVEHSADPWFDPRPLQLTDPGVRWADEQVALSRRVSQNHQGLRCNALEVVELTGEARYKYSKFPVTHR